MRKLLLALLLALASAVPAAAQDTCNRMFQVNQAAVALTQIITGVTGASIRICGIVISAGAAASTTSLSYGTGTNCGTGTTILMPVINSAINSSFVNHVPHPDWGPPSVNAAGVPINICLVTVGAGPTSVIIYYTQ